MQPVTVQTRSMERTGFGRFFTGSYASDLTPTLSDYGYDATTHTA